MLEKNNNNNIVVDDIDLGKRSSSSCLNSHSTLGSCRKILSVESVEDAFFLVF
jgi:hypothetical protein